MEIRLCPQCELVHTETATCPVCKENLILVDETFFLNKKIGKYSIEKILGHGGMGVVCRASHETLKRPAAIKILIPEIARDEFIRRFQLEARVLAELKHPYIVEIYDLDVSQWGLPFYIMEYLEGHSLRAEITKYPNGLPYILFTEYIHQIVSALAYAHEKGIIHRDLKPDNIFLHIISKEKVLKILDFGIAKIMEKSDSSTRLTQTGAMMGTPHYLAPEQLTNKDIGPHTDQYALALIALEMLTGISHRQGKTFNEIVFDDIQKPIDPKQIQRRDIPRQVCDALRRATDPQIGNRFPDLLTFERLLMGGKPEPDVFRMTKSHGEDSSLEQTVVGVKRTPTELIQKKSTSPSGPDAKTHSSYSHVIAGDKDTAEAVGASISLKKASYRYLLILLAAVLITGLPGYYFLDKYLGGSGGDMSETMGDDAHKPVSAGGKSDALLSLKKKIKLPGDTEFLIGNNLEKLLISGLHCVYILDLQKDEPFTRIPLDKDEKVIGYLGDGEMALLKGTTLLSRRYSINQVEGNMEAQDRVLAENFPPAKKIRLSPSAKVVAVQQEASVDVFQITGGKLRQIFSMAFEGEAPRDFGVSDKYAGMIQGEFLRVRTLPLGDAVLDIPFSEYGIYAFKFFDPRDLLVVSGWFDDVYIFDLHLREQLPGISSPGRTFDVFFLPDFPTLAVAKNSRILLWRPDGGLVAEYDAEGGSELMSIIFSYDGLLVRDMHSNTLLVFEYIGFPIENRFSISEKEIWGLSAHSDGHNLFVGGAEGTLYVLNVQSGQIVPYDVHTQGITSILSMGDHVTTSSDDKTIAVWKWPEMQVVYRNEAHRYLVNALYYSSSTKTLWSSSSDGTVKVWRWPRLKLLQTIEIGGYSNAALWVNQDETFMLVGNWKHCLVSLRKVAGQWHVNQIFPIESMGGYAMAELPETRVVVMSGSYPFDCYVYDLDSFSLFRLEDFDFDAGYCQAISKNKVLAVCAKGLLVYTFSRDSGELAYEVAGAVRTDLKTLYVSTALPRGAKIAAGNAAGEVILVDLQKIPFHPMKMPLHKPIIEK